ncbi:MAG: TIM barrel protein [Candidatus Latescibacteria bacterium]|nr:TIM barrel protein [Candidatus Latescibacterota bacterium]
MFIQDQLPASKVDDEHLAFFKAIGVDYLTINPPPFAADGIGREGPLLDDGAAVEDYLRQMKKRTESHGLKLQNIALTGPDDVTLARPGRDAKIEQWVQVLRAMGRVGVPTLGYNFKPIGNFRTPATSGRGGAQYSTFVYDDYRQNVPSHPDKQIGEESMWAHMAYFLERIVPVAQEEGVTLALHPDDPPRPEPMAGAARIVSTLDQYERIFALQSAPANAMLFCQGCVTEMGVDVYGAIRRMGAQGRICYVHFRNVRGTPDSFQEVFVDEGDVDMYEAMRIYREVGFEGPFMMDHTPGIPQDAEGRQGHAFATGFIRAMIQSVYR